ncbi:MAG: hypothetical protein ABJK03_01460 [Paracoccaceae bacterium]
MEKFTEEESDRLNGILSLEVNPYLFEGDHEGQHGSFDVHLGNTTRNWLFETRLNLPLAAQKELEWLDDDEISAKEKIHGLNDVLDERQVNSAPQWWELNFFDVRTQELWEFFVEQCSRHFEDDALRTAFGMLVKSYEDLEKARHILWVSKVNKNHFSVEEFQWALEIFDASYPLDFSDYDEPQGDRVPRSPLEQIRAFIGCELSDVGAVFTKRWFEFKILDELSSYLSYMHDGARDSELSKKISSQLKGYMNGQLIALGRMVEHYRWKFSFEEAALKGIQHANAYAARGKKGGKASEQKKRMNLECFMSELENLSDLYPQMNEAVIFQQAYENARQERPMPRSRKIIEEYGTIIRSDEDYKERYQKIFLKNA